MNQASFFIEKKALFGGYPNHKQVIELQQMGVIWFIDLTCSNEKNIKAYASIVENWINYPIKDQDIPQDRKKFVIFLFLLQMVLESLKPGEKLYLHCRGGHGRSSLVVSCFLSMVFNKLPFDSLNMVKEYHLQRPNLSPKWKFRWPLSLKQRQFVENLFGTIHMFTNFDPEMTIKNISTKTDFFRYLVTLNFYLHQRRYMLNTLLATGLKTIKGEGLTSIMLQELRLYILYSKAKNIFTLLDSKGHVDLSPS